MNVQYDVDDNDGGKVLFGCNVKNWQTNQRQKRNEKFINKSNFDPLAVDLMTCNVKKSRDFTILYICVRPQTFSSGISHTCFITSRSHIIIMLFVFDTKSTKREKSYRCCDKMTKFVQVASSQFYYYYYLDVISDVMHVTEQRNWDRILQNLFKQKSCSISRGGTHHICATHKIT